MRAASTTPVGTADAQRGRRVKVQSGRFDILAAAEAFTVAANVDALERSVDAEDLLATPLLGRIGHRLGLERIHPRQSANALLVKCDCRTRFRRLLAEQHKLDAQRGQSVPYRLIASHIRTNPRPASARGRWQGCT